MHLENYIDGKWCHTAEGRKFATVNPSTGEEIARFDRSEPADVDAAIEAAHRAGPDWRAMPAPLRANYLVRVARIAQDREDELSQRISEEHGKTIGDAHDDVQELIHVALYWAGEGRRQFGAMVPSEKRGKLGFSRREPLGVVVALLPWNFPLTKAALKVFPALVLGNTVVFKPAHETPFIGSLFQELLADAELPGGVVNLVQGHSEDIGDRLVDHPLVRLITHTGDTEVGRSIAARAGRRLVPVSLELGAKNALVVHADADLDLALDWAVRSATATSGQRETTASRLILHEDVEGQFTERLVDRLNRLRLGNPQDETTEIGPLISEEQLDAVEDYVRRAVESGGRILCGGRRAPVHGLDHGFFYPPTAVADLDPYSAVALEEVLGPVTMLYTFKELDDAITMANASSFGLSMSIFTSDIGTAISVCERFDSGVVWVNAGTVGAEVGLPFGGTKATGIGTTEWGPGAIDTFTRWKTTYINYSGEVRPVFEDTRLWYG